MGIFIIALVFNTSFFVEQVSGSEEENVDSFDVHPANRWSITNNGFTTTVDDSLLNISDTGDGTTDTIEFQRSLRSFDNKLVTRFLFNSNGTSTDGFSTFELGLTGGSGKIYWIEIRNIQEDTTTRTFLRFHDTVSGVSTTELTGAEALISGFWYILTIKFDILKSTIIFEMDFDNGTSVWDFSNIDLSTTQRPIIFDSQEILARIKMFTKADNQTNWLTIDYINAPFKERDWTNNDVPGDADWVENAKTFGLVTGAVAAETSEWRLTVPFLDTVGGTMTLNSTDNSLIGSGELFLCGVRVYGVEADDGSLTELLGFYMQIIELAPSPQQIVFVIVEGNNWLTVNTFKLINQTDLSLSPSANFLFGLSDDRDTLILKVSATPGDGSNWEPVATRDVSDIMTLASQEFVIETFFAATMIQADNEYSMVIENLNVILRTNYESLEGDLMPIVATGGPGSSIRGGEGPPVGLLESIFISVGNFIASIFRVVGDLIINAVTIGTALLATGLTLIETAVNALGSILGDILTEVTAIAVAIVGDIQDALDNLVIDIALILTDLGTLLTDIGTIITSLATLAGDIWTDFIASITAIVTALLGALLVAVETLWNIFVGIVFFIWDALALPDVLAIFQFLFVGIVQLVEDGLGAIEWLNDVIQVWQNGVFFLGTIVLLGIPAFMSKGPGEFMDNFLKANSWNILPIRVLGFAVHIPVGLVFWPLEFLVLFQMAG